MRALFGVFVDLERIGKGDGVRDLDRHVDNPLEALRPVILDAVGIDALGIGLAKVPGVLAIGRGSHGLARVRHPEGVHTILHECELARDLVGHGALRHHVEDVFLDGVEQGLDVAGVANVRAIIAFVLDPAAEASSNVDAAARTAFRVRDCGSVVFGIHVGPQVASLVKAFQQAVGMDLVEVGIGLSKVEGICSVAVVNDLVGIGFLPDHAFPGGAWLEVVPLLVVGSRGDLSAVGHVVRLYRALGNRLARRVELSVLHGIPAVLVILVRPGQLLAIARIEAGIVGEPKDGRHRFLVFGVHVLGVGIPLGVVAGRLVEGGHPAVLEGKVPVVLAVDGGGVVALVVPDVRLTVGEGHHVLVAVLDGRIRREPLLCHVQAAVHVCARAEGLQAGLRVVDCILDVALGLIGVLHEPRVGAVRNDVDGIECQAAELDDTDIDGRVLVGDRTQQVINIDGEIDVVVLRRR